MSFNNSSGKIFYRYDDRKGLGYGQLSNHFHAPRKLADTFPYTDDDPYAEDEFEDPESQAAIRSKSPLRRRTDFFAQNSADPFYFVAGNTKLSDCFFRVDNVLLEVEALGDYMFPIPSAYKGVRVGAGYASYLGPSTSTGTTRGWSSPPPDINLESETDEDEDEELEFYSLADLANTYR